MATAQTPRQQEIEGRKSAAANGLEDFVIRPDHVLAVGDAWDKLKPEARSAILMLTGFSWVGASGRWVEIPATARIGIVHGFYFFRDFMNRVLP